MEFSPYWHSAQPTSRNKDLIWRAFSQQGKLAYKKVLHIERQRHSPHKTYLREKQARLDNAKGHAEFSQHFPSKEEQQFTP
jgi:hypothetical protein